MESLARISNMLETARDLTLEAAQSASAAGRRKELLGPGSKASTVQEIRKLLNSRMDREVLEGLKRVIESLSRGSDCSEFFADVVKNVASPVLEFKKLVYIYLLRYAESEPDLALLSINTIQKSLTDQNPLIRAMAIRVMSGIRVPVISQIVALAIKKCVTDMSPYVRKSAALAIPKCYRLDPSTLGTLTDNLATLLGDRSFYVVGAAVMAFLEVCPERLDLVHKHYRGLCGMLVEMDEWGQLAVLNLLTVYARKCFPRHRKTTGGAKKSGNGASAAGPESAGVYVMDPDLEIFLTTCTLLLHSRNSAVIAAIAKAFHHLSSPGDTAYLTLISGPLVSLLRCPPDIAHMALINTVAIALAHPQLFVPYATHFLIQPFAEPSHIWKLKMEMLTLMFPHLKKSMRSLVFTELEYFAKGWDKELVKESVRAIGRCAQQAGATEGKIAKRCLGVLLRLITASSSGASASVVVAESLTVIRHIIQSQAALISSEKYANMVVIKLAQALDTTTHPQARASIIWLVGEFANYCYDDEDENDGGGGLGNIAADTLRILAKGFAGESKVVRGMIVLLAAKVYVAYLNRRNKKRESAAAQEGGTSTSSRNLTGFGGELEGVNPTNTDDNDEEDGDEDDGDDDDDDGDHPIPLLYTYILVLLSRYDVSYDLRDRARLYRSLLNTPSATQLASLLLQAPKPAPEAVSPSAKVLQGGRFTIGSASLALGVVDADGVGGGVRGYVGLPEWVKKGEEPGRELREGSVASGEVDVASAAAFGGGSGKGGKVVIVESGAGSRATGGGGTGLGKPQNGAVGVMAAGVGAGVPTAATLDEWLASTEDESEDEEGEDDDDDDEDEDEDEDETDDDEDEDEGESDEDDDDEGNEDYEGDENNTYDDKYKHEDEDENPGSGDEKSAMLKR